MASSSAAVDHQAVVGDLEKQFRALLRGRNSSKRKSGQPADAKKELTIKLRYKSENTKISLPRNENGTVDFLELGEYLQRTYGQRMNMFYTYHGSNIMVAITNQKELDTAVQMVDRTGQKNLYIILSMHEGSSRQPLSMMPDESGVYTLRVIEVPYTNNTPEPAVSTRMLSAASLDSGAGSFGASTSNQPTLPVNWRKGRSLGRGAYGEVFVAYDMDTSREICLKHILISSDETSRRDLSSFETDVIRLAQIQHPRLVRYLGVSTMPTDVLIFMEFMTGGSVKDLINQFGNLSEKVAEKYARQVLEGLIFLHEEMIAHRDIKSANLMRDINGSVKIGDFGSAKQLQALATQRGSCGGTPHYLAPEVVLGEKDAGRRADIWSLGVTLVEMVTGSVPYRKLPDMEATLKIAFEEPQSELPEKINPTLRTLARLLMTKNYDDRPTARQIWESTVWTVPD